MPKTTPYGQFCPIARALDLVGDRWTLLVVRELFLGPLRYGQLLDALPGLSTDVLATRLRQLTDRGLLRPGPAGYELTGAGRGLRPVLRALTRWGAAHLAAPTPDALRPRLAVLAIVLGSGRAEAARLGDRSVGLHVDGLDCELRAGPDGLDGRTGRSGPCDAEVRADTLTLYGLATGRFDLDAATAAGAVVEGDTEAARLVLVDIGFPAELRAG